MLKRNRLAPALIILSMGTIVGWGLISGLIEPGSGSTPTAVASICALVGSIALVAFAMGMEKQR